MKCAISAFICLLCALMAPLKQKLKSLRIEEEDFIVIIRSIFSLHSFCCRLVAIVFSTLYLWDDGSFYFILFQSYAVWLNDITMRLFLPLSHALPPTVGCVKLKCDNSLNVEWEKKATLYTLVHTRVLANNKKVYKIVRSKSDSVSHSHTHIVLYSSAIRGKKENKLNERECGSHTYAQNKVQCKQLHLLIHELVIYLLVWLTVTTLFSSSFLACWLSSFVNRIALLDSRLLSSVIRCECHSLSSCLWACEKLLL